MASMRTYGEACAAAHALDLIGERWALLVVRELLLGPKRFTDLRSGLPGASPNVLSQRLRELERVGVVRRGKLPPPAASKVYELTEWGMELEPAITALGRWGARSPHLPIEAGMGTDSLILSFRTMFDPSAAEGFEATLALILEDDRFHAIVADGSLIIARGTSENPDATISTDSDTMLALVYGDRPLDDAVRAGDVRIEGDETALARFLTLFPLPKQAPRAET